MTEQLCRSLGRLGACLTTPFIALANILSAALSAPIGTDSGGLTEAERERIRQSLWRIRRDLDALGGVHFIEELRPMLNEAFGGTEGLLRSVAAWADIVDTLVIEAEREFGSARGRGRFKKRHVKGALLYLVHRLDVDLPKVPAFIEPVVWDVLLDGVIDAVAQFSNRNRRWGDVPEKPSFRARLNVQGQRVALWTESFTALLTRIAWWIVLRSSPVSPNLKAAVDRFVAANPDPIRSVVVVAAWAAQHTRELVALTDLFSAAFNEAQFVVAADPQHRLAYAREIALAFIEESVGLPPRGSFSYLIIENLISFGMEIVAMLFEKRSPPPDAAKPAITP